MFDYEDFEDVFGPGEKVEYDGKAVKKIRENRNTLEGELFIDKLLKALGLSKGTGNLPLRVDSQEKDSHRSISPENLPSDNPLRSPFPPPRYHKQLLPRPLQMLHPLLSR